MSSRKHRGRAYRPYTFTEQGVAMLSSVLRSSRAVEVNIAIMRTFVQLRRLMDGNAELARKIESLEKKYDEKFATVFAAISNSSHRPCPRGSKSASIRNPDFSVLKLVRSPCSLAPTLVTLPSMSRVPRAPFTKTESPAYAPASSSILFPAF
jgi:hypothetical protein